MAKATTETHFAVHVAVHLAEHVAVHVAMHGRVSHCSAHVGGQARPASQEPAA
jgi:hypothetical protein